MVPVLLRQESPLSVSLPILLLVCAAMLAVSGGLVLVRQYRNSWHADRHTIAALTREVAALRQSSTAQQQAGAASEAKSRFIANISHEVRTPLAGITGMVDLLAGTQLNGEQRAYVEAIRQSGLALGGLIDEILDFSKMGSGKLELSLGPVSIIALVEGVAELMAPRAQAKSLEIACHVSPTVPPLVLGDMLRLRQILLNLASNAIKFTVRGGLGLRAEVSGNRLELTVTDTGTGIPVDRQQAIFEAFEQAQPATSRQHGGTGLGLTIARELAVAMDGSLVLVKSSPEGSVFRLGLPLVRTAAANVGQTRQSRPVRGRALVVAATLFEAGYLAAQLMELGFSARVEADGDAAIAGLKGANAPDLVIVDCGLGTRMVKSLASACAAANVTQSLILFSPLERRGLGEILSGAFDGWLVKPVRRQSLCTLLGQGETSPPGAASGPDPSGDRPRASILLAEDNDINALIATRHLNLLGADVVRATDGPTALALARRALLGETRAFDLILLDLRMPGLDGRDVVRSIRSLEAECGKRPTRLVALTANNHETDRHSCLAAGFDEFLAKPADFASLSRLLAVPHPVSRVA